MGTKATKPTDIRLNLDDELLTFLDSEVKRLRTSGRAGYITQLLAALAAARNGDRSLISTFDPQAPTTAVAPPVFTQPTSEAAQPNTNAVDDSLDSMF